MMERRAFLKLGLALAGGAAGALPRAFATAAEPPPGLADRLAALARSLRGRVVVPADPGYAMLAQLVVVADEGDIAGAIAFARGEGIDFVVRNGGHSFGGYSATGGLVIDVRSLKAVRPDVGAGTVTVGAGMTNLSLYQALWPLRMAVPAGTCPTVGVTGLALGGGFGSLSPLYGLACDNLLGLRLIKADGEIVTADERENTDLYWACRGGGGGNFGAVAELRFRMQPVDMPFTLGNWVFGWRSALKVLAAWQDWIAELPPDGHSYLQLVTGAPTPDGGPAVKIDLAFAGKPERGEALARDLIGAAGVEPTSADVEVQPFIVGEQDWTCAGLTPDECQVAGISPSGKLTRYAIYAASDFVTDPWPEDGLALLIEAIDRRQADRTLTPEAFQPDVHVGKVLMESTGGAINRIAPDATAFPHRSSRYFTQYQSRWLPGANAATVTANIAWTGAMFDSVAAYRSGASYVNYADPDLPDWQHAYYGANLDRLRQIKTKCDPYNVFRFPQSIPLA